MNAFSGFGPAIAAGKSGHGAVSMAVASGRVQLVTIRQESLTLARWRVLWVVLGFAFVAMLALVRIAYLGTSDDGARGDLARRSAAAARGEISDRNGVPLARAFPAYALWFNPNALGEDGAPLVRDPAVVARETEGDFPGSRTKRRSPRNLQRASRAISAGVCCPRRPTGCRKSASWRSKCRWKTTATIRKDRWRRMCSAMSRRMERAAWGWNRCSTSICPIRRRAAPRSPCRSIPASRARSRTSCAAG